MVGALLCLNLNIFSQNIPLKMNKVSVKKAMTELKEKSGYSFVYIAGDLDTKKIVDIDAEQLQEVIEQILEGQNVSYEIKDKNIVIRKKEVEQSMLNEKKLQDISGLVMDVMGEPIVGVNVMEKGTTNGTITDMDGKFLLKAPANATLIISFIGYKTLAVNLEGEKNVNITLKEDLEQFDLIVGMDRENLRDLKRLDKKGQWAGKIAPMCFFTTRFLDEEVPDPYYGGQEGFEYVVKLLQDGCGNLLERLKEQLSL